MGLVGHGCGVGDRRNLFHTTTVALLISFVVMVIMDFDRPSRGVIKVNQQSMIALRESLR